MYSHKVRRDSLSRAITILVGVTLGVFFTFLTDHFGLPIYLDMIGTVCVASIAGIFPGIMTAVMTDLVCMLTFNHYALYFCSVNTLIAIYTAWFTRENKFVSLKNITMFVASSGTIAGVLSAFIQWRLFNEPQHASIAAFVEAMSVSSIHLKVLFFYIANILINIVGLGISTGFAILFHLIIPKEIQFRIRNSGWRQKPLPVERCKQLDAANSDIRFSIRKRMTIMIFATMTAVVTIMSFIGLNLYFRSAKESMIENAYDTLDAAALVIDGDKIKDYVRYGDEAPGYRETNDMLYYIWKSSTDMEYLYVLIPSEEYVTFVFDVEDRESTGGVEAFIPGDMVAIEDAFKPYLPALLAGEEIEPIESDDRWNWIVTVYKPLFDSEGNCVAYVGADGSLDYMADYMKIFLLHLILILLGFFILLIGYALWSTGLFIVYPINSIVDEIEKFTNAGSEQKDLDEAVRSLRSLEIRTGDELEKLYRTICNMATNQTEQIRKVKKLSESTAQMQDGMIITMADLVENRDSDTGAHIQKTAAYVKIIVEGLKEKGYYSEKITPKFISDVVRSAPLHDIGKINIPDEVLNKPGKLTDEEYEIMKTHTTAGRKIMEKAISTVEGENYLKEARNMAAYHHERWDGKGYPEGLHGEVIPLSARIMAVADVFDALTSPRVYKPAFPLEKALSMIQEGAGTQFDAKCVEVFMEHLPEVKVILRKYNEEVVHE